MQKMQQANSSEEYTFLFIFFNLQGECTVVNLESTPGPTGQDERHVVSHFCYVSSNKLK